MTKTVPRRLRLAIQKSGRLNQDSMDLLIRCGLKIKTVRNSLLCHAENCPIDILFVRDDDIPSLIKDDVCDLGIIGENVLLEQTLPYPVLEKQYQCVKKLGFSRCRLSIAIPKEEAFQGPLSLSTKRIATSHPNILADYLSRHEIQAKIITISGSVEITPSLNMADAICDLVSTGRTLEENNLKEVDPVLESQAVLIKTVYPLTAEKQETFDLILRRIESVLKAQESKYIMFHAPKSSLAEITKILPGCETPTIMPLEGNMSKVAVHVVSGEGLFWITLEKLKSVGASSILVLPIEKMLN